MAKIITRNAEPRFLFSAAGRQRWTSVRAAALTFDSHEDAERVQGRLVGRFTTEVEDA